MIKRLAFTVVLILASISGLVSAAEAGDRASANPMRFALVASGLACPHCVIINAAGEFTDETSRDFATFVESLKAMSILPRERGRAGPHVVVGFDSPGGKVVTALILGRRIRDLGWTTMVGRAELKNGRVQMSASGCYSACSMAMLGGVDRVVVPASKAGVHQFSPLFGDKEMLSAAEMNDVIRDYGRQVVTVYDYVQEMGAPAAFFVETLRTPFASMDVLTPSQWTRLGIATRLLPAGRPLDVADVLDDGAEIPVAAASLPPERVMQTRTAMGELRPQVRPTPPVTAALVPSLMP